MEQYDFDRVVDRRDTRSLKWDFAVERGRPSDVLPLWIADMDFPAPEPVLDALRNAVDHGVFGYSDVKESYYEVVSRWFADRFQWKPCSEWLVKTPGVVFAIAMTIQALTQPGDSIMIQPPVYYPFFRVIRNNDRRVVENRLVYQNGRYTIDFEDLKEKIVSENVKVFLLCSPHNPVCRVWTEEELRKLGDICKANGVYVVSDEIHCDFAFPEHPHHTFLAAVPELEDHTVICTAPSKTFNLAGLQVSNIWVPNEDIRKKFLKEMDRSGYSQLNALGLVACQAAYENGEEWLDQCRLYMRANLDFLRDFLTIRLPQIKLVEPEGTYFAWLDCSGLGLCRRDLNDLIMNKARLWLDAGHIFGGGADQFQRIVLACSRSILERALFQLEEGIRKIF